MCVLMTSWWGKLREAEEGNCRSWWEVVPLLPLLCGTFPWRKREREKGDRSHLSLTLPPQGSSDGLCHRPEGVSILLWNSTSVRSHSEVPGNEDQACGVCCCFPYCTCKSSFNTGGTAAKCTHDPVDVPAKLIRNRGQEKKLTIAKFPCYCWFLKWS